MRASIIIAAHNEGASLWKTIRSCVESIGKLDCEILIADDASDDETVEEALRRFPQLSMHRHGQRQGASPTKHLGASNARGEVLVFLDGHCHPEPGAIRRLIEDVERLDGQSIVTPTILALDTARWKNKASQVGHGYRLELDTFDCGWLPLASLRKVRRAGRQFYESPAAIGCAFAVHRELYDDLRGFDPHMRIWGVEDLDFSLKCWLMGHSIMHDPDARIGHRFRDKFDNYEVPAQCILVNKLRTAYKNFTQGVWSEWLERCRQAHSGRLKEHPEGLWACAWNLFEADRTSAEQGRTYLLARRERDEFWYAKQFGLNWPRLESTDISVATPGAAGMQQEKSATGSPSPPPEVVDIDIEGIEDAVEESIGAVLVRPTDGSDGARRRVTLDSTFEGGSVRLSVQNSRVRVFTAPADGDELTFNGADNVFPVSALPKDLWVQGHLPSASQRDTSLTLTHIQEGASDRVTFTVLSERRRILLFGYWPPTDIGIPSRRGMLWNWQLKVDYKDSGYDVLAFSPTFSAPKGAWPDSPYWGKGEGTLEVDYRVTSRDFWDLVAHDRPIAIMSFSRGDNDKSWEMELNGRNHALLDWTIELPYWDVGEIVFDLSKAKKEKWSPPYPGGSPKDFSPYSGTGTRTGKPPDPKTDAGGVRTSNLPMGEIKAALDAHFKGDHVIAELDDAPTSDGGDFVSNYMGLHVGWYRAYIKDIKELAEDANVQCHFSGHTHVGSSVESTHGEKAIEIQLDLVVEKLKELADSE